MGLRFRKSINLGFGFRINLSKSGIGYSWGFPGYRITKMANGGNKTTYSLPGTGISYVEQNGKKSKNNSYELDIGETKKFKNIPLEELEKNDPILKRINKVVFLNRLSNLLIILTILMYYNPIFIFCLILGIVLKIVISVSKKVELYYEFDDDSRNMYNHLKEGLIILSNSKKIWQIDSSTKVYNIKYNAGAGNNISRNSAYVISKMPWYIKTNINIYGLNLKNQKMFFTPDRILVFRPFRKVFGCTYNNMNLGIKTIRFVESEKVYSDSEILDYTWKYSNKDNSRDLRFSNNKKYPICKYGELTIESPNGINTVVEFSNNHLLDDIQSNLIFFCNQFNKILLKSMNISKEEKEEFKEKNIVTNDSSQLSKTNDTILPNKIESQINKNYQLPKISVLSDKESKSIIPFVEKMKKQKKICIPIGVYQNDILLENIENMPNMLIGGTIMSGKSSYINTIISSILLTQKPEDIKMIIFDPKKVDYAVYDGIPHLLTPIINDSQKFVRALKCVSLLIEDRIKLLEKANVKNINQYNDMLSIEKEKVPTIIIFVDDLINSKIIEEISNEMEYITSNGWNVNVYVIVSANCSSNKTIPIISISNFPSRLSFKVTSHQESKIIINESGAEKLLGYGNALYVSRMINKAIKVSVPYITDNDIKNIINEWKKQNYIDESFQSDSVKSNDNDDSLYEEVLDYAIKTGKINASMIQRKFGIGYNRAMKIMNIFEKRKIVEVTNDSKPRNVLIKSEDGE